MNIYEKVNIQLLLVLLHLPSDNTIVPSHLVLVTDISTDSPYSVSIDQSLHSPPQVTSAAVHWAHTRALLLPEQPGLMEGDLQGPFQLKIFQYSLTKYSQYPAGSCRFLGQEEAEDGSAMDEPSPGDSITVTRVLLFYLCSHMSALGFNFEKPVEHLESISPA